jgi:hypothetical protein
LWRSITPLLSSEDGGFGARLEVYARSFRRAILRWADRPDDSRVRGG